MSYRLMQLSPQASTRVIRLRAVAPEFWTTAHGVSHDMGFLAEWFKPDSDCEQNEQARRINWGAISGMALSISLSATIWVGVALAVEHIWR